MATKLHIKVGSIELDYEGEFAFEKADVLELLDKLSALKPGAPDGDERAQDGGAGTKDLKMTSVSDIAQKLDVKTGAELVIASCASLHFLTQRSEFARKDITASMGDATHFFKSSYTKNLSVILQRLVKNGTLRSLGVNRYALSHAAIADLKERLA